MQVELSGLDFIVTEHLFDLKDRAAGLKQVLGVGVAQRVVDWGRTESAD